MVQRFVYCLSFLNLFPWVKHTLKVIDNNNILKTWISFAQTKKTRTWRLSDFDKSHVLSLNVRKQICYVRAVSGNHKNLCFIIIWYTFNISKVFKKIV